MTAFYVIVILCLCQIMRYFLPLIEKLNLLLCLIFLHYTKRGNEICGKINCPANMPEIASLSCKHANI